jgi:hypothetical protein
MNSIRCAIDVVPPCVAVHVTRRVDASTRPDDRPDRRQHKVGSQLSQWRSDELMRIAEADELEIASVRPDGTVRRPVTIGVVCAGDDLYVRSVNGRSATWFRGAQDRHEARIRADGVTKDVELVEVADNTDAIDAAYRTKYRRYAASIIDSIVSPKAGAATLKLVPRTTKADI